MAVSEKPGQPGGIPDALFRGLTQSEEDSFRRWAREHSAPRYVAKASLFHPTVRDEWRRMGIRTTGYGAEDGSGPSA